MSNEKPEPEAKNLTDNRVPSGAWFGASVSVVITDPPYSSGGMMRGDRAGQSCKAKYQQPPPPKETQ